MKLYALHTQNTLLIYMSEHSGDDYLHLQDMTYDYIEEVHNVDDLSVLDTMYDWSKRWVPVEAKRFTSGWYTASAVDVPAAAC